MEISCAFTIHENFDNLMSQGNEFDSFTAKPGLSVPWQVKSKLVKLKGIDAFSGYIWHPPRYTEHYALFQSLP